MTPSTVCTPRSASAAAIAKESSQTAAGGLSRGGCAIGAALSHVAETWGHQAQTLTDACAHISNHFDYTRNAHAGDEVCIALTVSSISQLDKGFDERTQH